MIEETDPGAQRRETYRLARRAYLDAHAACQKFRYTLQSAIDATGSLHQGQWPTAQARHQITPPPMPDTGSTANKSLPTDAELDAALKQRHSARAAITDAWAAMTRAEQDECAPPPEGLNLQRKY
jgi:hypothetical protein